MAVHAGQQHVVRGAVEVPRRGAAGAGLELLRSLGGDKGQVHRAVVRSVLLGRAAVAAKADAAGGEATREDLPLVARARAVVVGRVAEGVVAEASLLVPVAEARGDPCRHVVGEMVRS